jgi:hypothetical protein
MCPVYELLPPELGPVFHIGPVERLDIDAILERAAEREMVDDVTALRHRRVVREVVARGRTDEFSRLTGTFPNLM